MNSLALMEGATGHAIDSLVFLERNDVYTNTYIIAQNVGYAHKDITAHIVKHKARFQRMGNNYVHSVIVPGSKKPVQAIALNEQQAIFLMTLLDNSEIVLDFKMALAMQFVKMRRLLLQKQTADWKQTRLQGKEVRLQETDAIKGLIDYAREQGSQNADKLYVVYSKLVKQLAQCGSRDMADVNTLMETLTFERLLGGIIASEMAANTHYKAIYRKAKLQLMEIKRLWAMPRLTA